MIYFNNAATTWPKPEEVYRAVDEAFRCAPTHARAAAGRATADTLLEARREVASFLGISEPTRLIFTPGCTYSLNLAIHGLEWRSGDVAVMSSLEHHAVSRPLRRIAAEKGVRLLLAPYSRESPVDLDFIETTIKRGGVRLVACTMASNVTGDITPASDVVRMCKRHGVTCLLDAAQVAGVLPLDIERMTPSGGPDMVSAAGHKGLFGPPGVGLFYAAPGLALNPRTLGGTGQDSGKHEMNDKWPHTYEVGTHNLPAILGLAAGVRWVRNTGIGTIHAHEQTLLARLEAGLTMLKGVTIHGNPSPGARTSVASITISGKTPQELAAALAEKHGIVSRAGYHCSPGAHETIGTLPGPGTLRFSPGWFNTESEVDRVIDAMREELRS